MSRQAGGHRRPPLTRVATARRLADMAGPAPRRAADLWWLHPTRIVLLALLPVYLAILAYDFSGVVKNVYIPSLQYYFGIVLLLSLALGNQWALAQSRQGPVAVPPQLSAGLMLALLLPALLSYLVWFGPLLGKPQLLLEIVRGERAELRDAISTMPGVTTFTQFGVAYAIAYAIKRGTGMQAVRTWEHLGFWLLVGLAVFRAFAWAERLAVIELLLCYVIARMAYLPVASPRRWRLAAIAPLVGPPVLYLLFTASEYFRSWEYYTDQFDSVWAFTLDRLITYYATAANNGIGILVDNTSWPYYKGAFALEWLYITPGLSQVLDAAFGNPRPVQAVWIETYARPEFNSPTAYFRIVLDLGYLGAVLFLLAIGYLMGRAYSGFRRGHTFGLLVFPVCVLFLVESSALQLLWRNAHGAAGAGAGVDRLRHPAHAPPVARAAALAAAGWPVRLAELNGLGCLTGLPVDG